MSVLISDSDEALESKGREKEDDNDNIGDKEVGDVGRSRSIGSVRQDNDSHKNWSTPYPPEENALLRRHLKKQEEKIKLLATKLVRLVGDKRKKEKRDEILIGEQKARIEELEAQVSSLRDKLQVSREQLASYTKLIPTNLHNLHHTHNYNAPSKGSKVFTIPSSGGKKKPSSYGETISGRPSSSSALLDHEFTSKVEKLLLEAKAENQALEDQLVLTKERLATTEKEVALCHSKMKAMESDHSESLIRVREGEDRFKKRKTLQDNIQLIRLQRESRRTSSWLSTLEAQCRSLETTLASKNETISQLESQLADAEQDVRDGQGKSLALQKDMEDKASQLSRLKELEALISFLQEENGILKHTNESFVEKALSTASLRPKGDGTISSSLNSLSLPEAQSQLLKLEGIIKSEVSQKAEIVGVLSAEKARSALLLENIKDLKEQVDQLSEKVRELDALLLLERKKNAEFEMQKNGNDPRQNLSSSGNNASFNLEAELGQTQWQLVQVRDELDKTRSLLRTQMTINKECQREVEGLTGKLDKAETFHHERLQEFMNLLEQRTRQMSLLETTLEMMHRRRDEHETHEEILENDEGKIDRPNDEKTHLDA